MEKQSATCLRMEEGPAHYAEGQGLSYCIRIKRKQIKQLKFAKTAVINNR
ncbi:hypothetical protein [Neobacillus ginsengisoli]|uniref:Uncharacterized protein n=1 Tax=Neobacillus ginsengisoli TaxID=904295 RepID=A0ABT9Y175_9BACI|nr:hypothetical protein [Neobacillus ginsengisoli]MDQ0201565.1 hypothetical protein [Neobacillus ginsengisoli]